MLVGRERELQELIAALSSGESVALFGSAGVGKSALLRAAAAACGRRPFFGGGLAQLMWEPYLPLMRALNVRMRGGDGAAVAEFVVTVVGDGVLVLDDLHCADLETLTILPLIAREVTVLGASRLGDPRDLDVRRACAGEIRTLNLAALGDEAAAAIVRACNPRLGSEEVTRCVSAAGGSPLFLEQLAVTGKPSSTLARAIDVRLAGCSTRGRLALATVALRGQACERSALGEEAVLELIEMDFVEPRGTRVGLRQPLVAARAAQALSVDLRKRLHLQLAAALADPAERARHLAAGGDRAAARESALEAAASASRPGARARHLALAAACSDGVEADTARVDAAAAMLDAGEPMKALALAEPVARDSEHAPRARLLRARAALAVGEASIAARAATDGLALAEPHGADALALQIELLRADGGSLTSADRVREARECIASSDVLGAHRARARLLLGSIECQNDDPDWQNTVSGAIDCAREEGDADAEFLAGQMLVVAGVALGDRRAVLRMRVEEFEARARDLLLRGWELQFAVVRLWLDLIVEGRCEAVDSECRALLASPATAGQRDQLEAMLGLSLADRGRVEEARDRVGRASAKRPSAGRSLLSWVEAETAWLAGSMDALELAQRCLSEHGSQRPVGALASVTAGWAARESGEPFPKPQDYALEYGGADLELAGLLRLPSEPLTAESRFVIAGVAWRDVQARGALRCAWGAGEALHAAGEDEEALAQLRTADELVAESEVRVLAPRIGRSRRTLGERRGNPPNQDKHGLTSREREIMKLAAAGLSNPDIASRLSIAAATVDTHLKHVKGKLGVTSRKEAIIKFVSLPGPADHTRDTDGPEHHEPDDQS